MKVIQSAAKYTRTQQCILRNDHRIDGAKNGTFDNGNYSDYSPQKFISFGIDSQANKLNGMKMDCEKSEAR